MTVGELPPREFAARIARPGIALQTGPFVVSLQTTVPVVAEAVHSLYRDFSLAGADELVDFHVRTRYRSGLHRWWRREVVYFFDGEPMFEPAPLELAIPTLEWNLNWIAATIAHYHVFLHSAVVERDGRAVILPGTSGAGKSTLCAGLIHRGWRLFSDEFGLLRLRDTLLVPWPRPLSLKATGIDRIRAFAPEAPIGPVSIETNKGFVAQMRPPTESVRRAREPAVPAWIVFPTYELDAPTRWTPLSRSRAFMRLAGNSTNAEYLGLPAFETLARVTETTEAFDLVYSDLDQAIELISALQAPRTAG